MFGNDFYRKTKWKDEKLGAEFEYTEIPADLKEQADEEVCEKIDAAGVKSIRVYSVMTCGSKEGVCATSYGRDLSRGKMVHVGEAIGMISAQSIGEPGTQLTMRTFHVGGIAGNISEDNNLSVRFDGVAEIEDLKVVKSKDSEGKTINTVISRTCEIKVLDKKSGIVLSTNIIPYGSSILVKDGQVLKKGDIVCQVLYKKF